MKLFVDGSINREGSRIRIVLESPTRGKILKDFKLDFPASNNEVEYEALLTSLKMEKDMDIKSIKVFFDSKLVSSQINSEFEARESRMVTYLKFARDMVSHFDSFEINHILEQLIWRQTCCPK